MLKFVADIFVTRELCEEYAKEVKKLSFKLMGLIALSLGLAADRFDKCFEDSTSFIRLNYYPPCPSPDLALGVGRHKDAGALTVLYQDDVGGLEVKRKTDGEWIRVKPTPNAYIINVGDIIQVLCLALLSLSPKSLIANIMHTRIINLITNIRLQQILFLCFF